jgi:hypothetical protein
VTLVLYPLLACAAGPPDDSTAAPDPTEDIAVDVVAEWSAAELEAALDSVLTAPVPDVRDARDAYLAALAMGDADCPGSPDQLGGADLRGCTTDSGYSYAGVATYMTDPSGGFVLSGDFEILTPDGRRFVGGGALSEGIFDGGWNTRWTGIWSLEGDEGWLGHGVGAWWTESGGEGPQGPWVELADGLTYGDVSLWFDRLRHDLGTCPDGASGVLRVRDPSGGWFSLDYGDTCAPCAALSFEGEPLGESCPAIAAWLDDVAVAW